MALTARPRPLLSSAVGLLLAVACGGGDAAPAAGERAGAATTVSATAGKAPCAPTGHWSRCQVQRRLEQAGVAPRDTIAIAGLPDVGEKPALLMVGRAALAVYLFPDAAAAQRAARGLDTALFISPGKSLTVRNETTAILNDNLLALLFSQREQQRERVSDALLAGPPQQ